MKKRKATLYDPYLDTLGGGEKHILSVLQVLEEEGIEPYIFWDSDVTELIHNKLNITFRNIHFLPNIFKERKSSSIEKFLQLGQFDFFFYVTDGSYFLSSARKNFVFCMYPKKDLYQRTLVNQIKTMNYQFIANSYYTNSWLKQWGVTAQILYPYLDSEFLNTDRKLKKEKIILSVGRFFPHLHSKKQDIVIKTFQQLRKDVPQLKDFKLVLIGNLKDEDKSYFESLKELAENDPSILLKPNVSFNELIDFYKKSLLYWHFAGYNVDENVTPELVEHLGIAPLEAMSFQCIVFCYNVGGPKEIVKNGENAFLFHSVDELKRQVISITENVQQQRVMQRNAREFVSNNFNYEVFKTRVQQLILK